MTKAARFLPFAFWGNETKTPTPKPIRYFLSMKRVQQLHLWLGTLFAPLIIFFSLSGALQTLGLHEREKAGGSTPSWIAQIASIHKNQGLQSGEGGPPRRPAKGASANRGEGEGQRSDGDAPEGARRGPSPWPLKWFVVLMSIGLIVTTGLGVWMSFKYSKNKLAVWGLLAAGTLLPIGLLFL